MLAENGEVNISSQALDIIQVDLPGLVSDNIYWYLMAVILILDFLTAFVATTANIITIIVYYRLGYSDTTNISLSALAMSDLGGALTTFTCIMAVALPLVPDTPFTFEMFFTSGAAPHNIFSRISALITTYLSVERYLCVSLPLKIKGIFTPRRTFIAMSIIFVTTFSNYPVVLLRFPVGWTFVPWLNRTMLSFLPVTDETTLTLFDVFITYMFFFLPIFTFSTVVFSTILLSLTLEKSKRWRDANRSTNLTTSAAAAAAKSRGDAGGGKTSSTLEPTTAASKETRAVKMVIAITTVFILSFIPSCAHMIAQELIPDFFMGGRYSKTYLLAGMAYLITDCLNCSANVIIYYNMSSKFRLATRKLFNADEK